MPGGAAKPAAPHVAPDRLERLAQIVTALQIVAALAEGDAEDRGTARAHRLWTLAASRSRVALEAV